MRAPSTVAAILATTLVAAGCAGGSEDDDRQDSLAGDQPSQSSQGVGNLDSSTSGETEPGDTASEQDSGGGIASREAQMDGVPVRLEITDLVRSGSTTALTFELSVAESRAGETDAGPSISQTFDDGTVGEIDGEKGQEPFTVDGISLIDTTNSKRYLVARDSEGVCVCESDLSSANVEPGSPKALSATFGAPPADVDAVDIVIPNFGTFKNVPLS